VVAIALARKAVVAPARQAALWWIAAGICAVAPVAVAVLAGDRIVRRFSRDCIGRAPGPQDIRVAPRDESRREHLAFGQRG
jgi:hypothetical protein